MTFRRTHFAVVAALLLLLTPFTSRAGERKTYKEAPKMQIDPNKQYKAIIETSQGKIVADLFPKEAPQTVNSFVFLSKEKFYDGLTFHRVEDWVIQGGDPDGNGTGGPGYTLPNEAKNNTHKHKPGTLAMARTADPDSAGSQFYITKETASHLDGAYTIFGEVTEGMDVVNKIQKGDEIKSIKIEEK